jgi:hypothetical protein
MDVAIGENQALCGLVAPVGVSSKLTSNCTVA